MSSYVTVLNYLHSYLCAIFSLVSAHAVSKLLCRWNC